MMPESRLTLSVTDLKAAIGHELGYGRGADFSEGSWSTMQTNDITDVLKSALAMVYTPPPLAPGGPVHNWSWLRPFVTLTLESGTKALRLPDDFGGFEGNVFVTGSSAGRYHPLKLVNIGQVELRHASHPDATGFPLMAAERVLKGTDENSAGRTELFVWPTADSEYTLRAQIYYHPDSLTGLHPYPPGGGQHSELFKAACAAAAEVWKDDARGVKYAYFMERLAASIGVDRKRKGSSLGYNGDWTEAGDTGHSARDYMRRFGWGNPVLIQGVEYE